METSRERQKLLNRVKRIRGQVESVERTLTVQHDCFNLLMLLAAVRGGVNALMAEVVEEHIREHLVREGKGILTADRAEELVDLMRAYLK